MKPFTIQQIRYLAAGQLLRTAPEQRYNRQPLRGQIPFLIGVVLGLLLWFFTGCVACPYNELPHCFYPDTWDSCAEQCYDEGFLTGEQVESTICEIDKTAHGLPMIDRACRCFANPGCE